MTVVQLIRLKFIVFPLLVVPGGNCAINCQVKLINKLIAYMDIKLWFIYLNTYENKKAILQVFFSCITFLNVHKIYHYTK